MLRSSSVRAFEQLETRTVLSGCSVAAGVAAGLSIAASHHDTSNIAVLASSRLAGSASIQGTFLSATLSDPNDANVTGHVSFTSITHNGTTTSVFTANISGAAANTPYEVDINGTAVGTIMTDDSGSGAIALKGSLAVTPAAGDTVTVGAATGTLAVRGHDGGDEGDETEVHLTANLADTTGAVTGTASFKSETEDGTTQSKLVVTIQGATPSMDIPVLIDGASVGTISTDADGNGSLVLKDAAITVNEGSTISVDTATGTFAVAAEVHVVDVLHLRSRLSDPASGATGTAIFMSRTLSDGTVDSKLIVNVHGATAGSMLDVAIDGTVVGQVQTDANGNGHTLLTNVSVTPAAGSAISVDTTITGTLDVKANLGLHLARGRH